MFSIILEEDWYPEEEVVEQARSAPKRASQASNPRKRPHKEEVRMKPERQSRTEKQDRYKKSKKSKHERRRPSRSESRRRSSRHSKPESKKKRRKDKRRSSPDFSSSEYDSVSSPDRKSCTVGGAAIEQSTVRSANPVESHPDWALMQPAELEIERTNYRSYANVSEFFVRYILILLDITFKIRFL